MVNTVQMFRSPEGDVVEATPHEYVTRLKGLGYTRATPDAATEERLQEDENNGLTEVTPEVEHEVETPEATDVDSALNRTFRRQRDR